MTEAHTVDQEEGRQGRRHRAVTLGRQAGLWAAGLSLFTGVPRAISDPEFPGLARALAVAWVPAISFAFFFAVVFPLALVFQPNREEFDRNLRFAGARWLVWPVIALLVAAVVVLVIQNP